METLDIRCPEFSSGLYATQADILTPMRSTIPYETASPPMERSPTTPARRAGNSNFQIPISKQMYKIQISKIKFQMFGICYLFFVIYYFV